MVWLQVGPEIIIGEDTGKIAFVEIGGNLLLILFFGCFLLPLLTDFGFMEFVGMLAEPIITPTSGFGGEADLFPTRFDQVRVKCPLFSIAAFVPGHEYKNCLTRIIGNKLHSLDHPTLCVRIVWNHSMIDDLTVVPAHPDLEWNKTVMALPVSPRQPDPQQTRAGCGLNPRAQM